MLLVSIFLYIFTLTITQFAAAKSLQSCLTLCDPIDCNTPGLPVHPQLPELAQTHAHQVGDAASIEHLCMPGSLLSC